VKGTIGPASRLAREDEEMEGDGVSDLTTAAAVLGHMTVNIPSARDALTSDS